MTKTSELKILKYDFYGILTLFLKFDEMHKLVSVDFDSDCKAVLKHESKNHLRVLRFLDNYKKYVFLDLFDILKTDKLTDFQHNIYSKLSGIKYGLTISYSKLGELAGYPKSARGVGQAMAKNPWPILVPCHRVLAKNGVGGYSSGLEIKRRLLRFESIPL